MKPNATIFILLAILLSWTGMVGQTSNSFEVAKYNTPNHSNERCLTNHKRSLNFQNHPELLKKRHQVQAASQQWVRDNEHQVMNRTTSAVINIPVVVHVVYANTTQNISDAQINSQITVLNDDFSLNNSNFSTAVPTVFQSLAADVEISFCLAQVDPSGAATTGVTRTSTTIADVGATATSNIYYTANGGKDSWDESRYMNIWVCEVDASGALLGYASLPGTASAGEDGIVIDYKYFGTIGTVTAPIDLGRTGTHEVGHYFNLEHIWGDGPCGTDDGVTDTPEAAADYSGCPTHPQNTCTSDDMFMNYMDYVDDACMGLFTLGQKTRMLAAANGPRVGLVNNSAACGASSVAGIERNSLALTVFPNPVNRNTVRIAINSTSVNDAQMRIMDITGRVLVNGAINQYTDVDVRTLNAGVYFVEVVQDNKRAIHKLIVQ
jgi:hypothetical protein